MSINLLVQELKDWEQERRIKDIKKSCLRGNNICWQCHPCSRNTWMWPIIYFFPVSFRSHNLFSVLHEISCHFNHFLNISYLRFNIQLSHVHAQGHSFSDIHPGPAWLQNLNSAPQVDISTDQLVTVRWGKRQFKKKFECADKFEVWIENNDEERRLCPIAKHNG